MNSNASHANRKLLVAFCALAALTSCRNLTAPQFSRGELEPAKTKLHGVPELLGLAGTTTHRDLVFRAKLDRKAELNRDWTFQVFLNTDESPTGYDGFDLLVRPMESTDGKTCPLRTTDHGTIGPGNPDGWGPIVGEAKIKDGRHLEIRVRLDALHDDGACIWRVETYTDTGEFFVAQYIGAVTNALTVSE